MSLPPRFDVTVQAQIMTRFNELKREFNTAIIMITTICGRGYLRYMSPVMYAGRTMEYGKARDVFYQARSSVFDRPA